MHRKVLVAFDASASALPALDEATTLAGNLGLELHALWVEPPLTSAEMFVDCGDAVRDRVWVKERAAREQQHRMVREHLLTLSESSGVPIVSVVRSNDQTVKTILRVAAEGAYSLIVLGSAQRPRLRYRLFGNTADWVAHRARCDVLVVRGKSPASYLASTASEGTAINAVQTKQTAVRATTRDTIL